MSRAAKWRYLKTQNAFGDVESNRTLTSFRDKSLMLVAALCWIVGVNAWTMLRFRQDKVRAMAGHRRVPEADLLWLAAIGGTPGAFTARHLYRHKTRKEPFSTLLMLIAAAQIGVGGTLLFF